MSDVMPDKVAKICEDIHDYLDTIGVLLDSTVPNSKMPLKTITARSVMISEVPSMICAIEVLTQTVAKSVRIIDGPEKLAFIRALEEVNYRLNEALPNKKLLS